jgi:hypothetical protein
MSRTEKIILILFAKSFQIFTGHHQVLVDHNYSSSARWIDCCYTYITVI